jgi:hypothetical protein
MFLMATIVSSKVEPLHLNRIWAHLWTLIVTACATGLGFLLVSQSYSQQQVFWFGATGFMLGISLVQASLIWHHALRLRSHGPPFRARRRTWAMHELRMDLHMRSGLVLLLLAIVLSCMMTIVPGNWFLVITFASWGMTSNHLFLAATHRGEIDRCRG